MREIDRFRGCLLGGAAGDALGYPVEFLTEAEIRRRFGARGITKYELHGGIAEISDDTQMTMFTATGLLYGTTRGRLRGIMGNYEDYLRSHYRDWYRTQTEPYPLPGKYPYSWLVNLPELFSRRAPGNTCLSALASGENASTRHPINRSKGCGGVMRVAPIGLYFAEKIWTAAQSDTIGAEAAAVTHGHELGWLPAACLVHIIRFLTEREDASVLAAVRDAMAALPETFPGTEHMDELLELLQRAVGLAASRTKDADAIRQLGEGWVGDEALAIAVFCALRHADRLLARNRGIVRKNLAVLDAWVQSEPRISYVKPKSGTTALVSYDYDIESYDFCARMHRETGAFVTPGACFGVEKTMRIGYASDRQTLEAGLAAVSAFLRKLEEEGK